MQDKSRHYVIGKKMILILIPMNGRLCLTQIRKRGLMAGSFVRKESDCARVNQLGENVVAVIILL